MNCIWHETLNSDQRIYFNTVMKQNIPSFHVVTSELHACYFFYLFFFFVAITMCRMSQIPSSVWYYHRDSDGSSISCWQKKRKKKKKWKPHFWKILYHLSICSTFSRPTWRLRLLCEVGSDCLICHGCGKRKCSPKNENSLIISSPPCRWKVTWTLFAHKLIVTFS